MNRAPLRTNHHPDLHPNHQTPTIIISPQIRMIQPKAISNYFKGSFNYSSGRKTRKDKPTRGQMAAKERNIDLLNIANVIQDGQ